MKLTMDQYGVESLLIVLVYWGGSVTPSRYSGRAIGSYAGVILSGCTVSKTAKIGDSGVSATCSLALDDTDGSLKNVYDTTVMEGSKVEVYQRLRKIDTTYIDTLILSGFVSSSIVWSEGERTLTISVEGGAANAFSGELGYAPEENAWSTFNNNAAGKNWPLVFGTASKVPGVRVEYQDEMTLGETIVRTTPTYTISGGGGLPQAPTSITLRIGRLLFAGTMADEIFTPTGTNLAEYTNVVLGARIPGDVDVNNPTVFFTPSSFTGNLNGMYVLVDYGTYKFVNYVVSRDPIEPTKWKCTLDFPTMLNATHTLAEVAGWPRYGWATNYESYSQGGSLIDVKIAGDWMIAAGAPVRRILNLTYTDKYVVNLYPSTAVGVVWGKRTFWGKEIWAKIPASYYTVILSDTITTLPGSVVRHPTSITFDEALSSRECEKWKDEIYVEVVSTLTSVPDQLVQWVVTNFTSMTFDATSDSLIPRTNFAYFQTTDAMQFLEEYAWQLCSVILVTGTTVRLQNLAIAPALLPAGRLHTVDKDLVILKTLDLSTRSKEDINTVIKATYVTDYSGLEYASKELVVRSNTTKYGIQEKTYDFWALTIQEDVSAAANFWSFRNSESWKTLTADLLIDATNFNPYDTCLFNFGLPILDGLHGCLESVVHETDSPHVSITALLAVPAGSETESADFWIADWIAPSAIPFVAATDFNVPLDDTCPTYWVFGGSTTLPPYKIVITKWPVRLRRGQSFVIEAELQDRDGVLAPLTTNIGEIKLRLSTPMTRDRWFDVDMIFFGGLYSGTFQFRGGIGTNSVVLTVEIRSYIKTIASGFPAKPPMGR